MIENYGAWISNSSIVTCELLEHPPITTYTQRVAFGEKQPQLDQANELVVALQAIEVVRRSWMKGGHGTAPSDSLISRRRLVSASFSRALMDRSTGCIAVSTVGRRAFRSWGVGAGSLLVLGASLQKPSSWVEKGVTWRFLTFFKWASGADVCLNAVRRYAPSGDASKERGLSFDMGVVGHRPRVTR